MKLTLTRLTLENFKGQSTIFQFSDHTYIYGANGSGKTTQYDAFLWLLFGKDSQGRTDYKIKPLLPDWTEQHHVTVSVQGVFDIDGQQVVLKRIYTEKWPKKKGAEEAEYDGDKTEYEYNGVPCNQTEYKTRVSAFVDETLFRLITSASYFNSMKWQDRRDMLLQAAGEPSNEEVAGKDESLLNLLSLCSGKLLDDYRKEVAAKKKPIKKELDGIPFAKEEVKKQIVDKDWAILENDLASKTTRIDTLQAGIDNENLRVQNANKETNQRIQSLLNDIATLERKKMSIESNHKSKYNNELLSVQSAQSKLKYEIENNEKLIKQQLETEQTNRSSAEASRERHTEMVNRYYAIQKGEISDLDKICPACGRAFEGEDFQKLLEKLLQSVVKEGFNVKELLDTYITLADKAAAAALELREKTDRLLEEQKKMEHTPVKHYVSSTNEDTEYQEVVKMIADKNEMIGIISESEERSGDLTQAKSEIYTLKKEVDVLNQELYEKEIAERGRSRLSELNKKEKNLSVELASLEKIEICADRFIKCKLDMMEERVNAMFSLVKWKMYEPQVNGGEKEICECGIDGKTFGSLNSAARVNAGLDIANTFSRINNVYAPIWIDNRESVTDIIPVESQTISLIVSPEHKVLTIKN